MVQGIVFLLNNDSAQGPFNLSAPHPVSNAEFSRHLARILRRPYFLSVPAWVMKMAMGEIQGGNLKGLGETAIS